MKNPFGFSLIKSSQINLNEADKTLSNYLLENEPTFAKCISCGSCTGTCTAGEYTDLNLRQIQLLIKRGQLDEVTAKASKCMLCGKCSFICPKGVNTRHILQLIKLYDDRKI